MGALWPAVLVDVAGSVMTFATGALCPAVASAPTPTATTEVIGVGADALANPDVGNWRITATAGGPLAVALPATSAATTVAIGPVCGAVTLLVISTGFASVRVVGVNWPAVACPAAPTAMTLAMGALCPDVLVAVVDDNTTKMMDVDWPAVDVFAVVTASTVETGDDCPAVAALVVSDRLASALITGVDCPAVLALVAGRLRTVPVGVDCPAVEVFVAGSERTCPVGVCCPAVDWPATAEMVTFVEVDDGAKPTACAALICDAPIVPVSVPVEPEAAPVL